MSTTMQEAIYEAAEMISRTEREARKALRTGTLKNFMETNKAELVSFHWSRDIQDAPLIHIVQNSFPCKGQECGSAAARPTKFPAALCAPLGRKKRRPQLLIDGGNNIVNMGCSPTGSGATRSARPEQGKKHGPFCVSRPARATRQLFLIKSLPARGRPLNTNAKIIDADSRSSRSNQSRSDNCGLHERAIAGNYSVQERKGEADPI